ncbi:MAG: methyltransferase, partial [Desulfurococcaceae archaeon]
MKKYPLLTFIGDVYRPSDDSWLILSLLDKTSPKGDLCLDLGAGSGILGLYALLNGNCKRIVFVDVHEDAVETIVANIRLNGVVHAITILSDDITLRESSVEIVLANPPYLPIQRTNHVDIATEGGVNGYETTLYF